MSGAVLDRASIGRAVARRGAVICALGTPCPRKPSTLLRDGTENLVSAMTKQGVRRLVCVTLLGVGASRSNCSFIHGELILRALSPMLPDKEAQEQVVRDSGLDWVLVHHRALHVAGPAAISECCAREIGGGLVTSSAPSLPGS